MKYCSKWSLQHNFNGTKLMVFQKDKNWTARYEGTSMVRDSKC